MSAFESTMLRLKERVGIPSDKGIAELLGMTDKALNARKRRDAFPDDKLFALAAKRPDLELDVMYVLTGTTTALRSALNDLRSATEVAQAVGGSREQQLAVQEAEFHRLQAPRMSDLERLAAAIGAVEEGLAETRRKLPPDKRAELIFAAYQLMAEPQQTRDNVVRLVRTAA